MASTKPAILPRVGGLSTGTLPSDGALMQCVCPSNVLSFFVNDMSNRLSAKGDILSGLSLDDNQ